MCAGASGSSARPRDIEARPPLHAVRLAREGPTFRSVMELVEGATLAARLARGPMAVDLAVRCAAEIADALASAHAAGIVHRDLKPANIMLTRSGVKLLDFGLARLRPAPATRPSADESTEALLTMRGVLLGTLAYMAPEQMRGDEVDGRTDLFAFGAVVYEMIAGERAFAADSQAALIAAILERDPPALTRARRSGAHALEHGGPLHARIPFFFVAGRTRATSARAKESGGERDGRRGPLTGCAGRAAMVGARSWALAAALVGLAVWRFSRAAWPSAGDSGGDRVMDSPMPGTGLRPAHSRPAAPRGDVNEIWPGCRSSRQRTQPDLAREEQVARQTRTSSSHLSGLLDDR